MNTGGSTGPTGALIAQLQTVRRPAAWQWKLRNSIRWAFILGWLQTLFARAASSLLGVLTVTSELRGVAYVLRDEDRDYYQKLSEQLERTGDLEVKQEMDKLLARRTAVDYGVLGRRVVTTAFVSFVVDQLQTETSVFGDFKFHDSGVGTTAENITDTGIETTDGESRATGTQTESAANAYRSVGTIAYTTTKAITEHGLFNDATTGTLMDRTVFSAVNVVNGDSVTYTYTLTISAGG